MQNPMETVVDIDSVCRLCANLQENLVPLFEGEGQENMLPDRISKYLDISVHMKAGLPSSVCVQCTMSLLDWHRFYKNCERVNENFRELLIANARSGTAPKATKPAIESDDDDDVVGIDFDEDSSAFNKILKEAEITVLDNDVAQEEVILTAANIMEVMNDSEREPEPVASVAAVPAKGESAAAETAISESAQRKSNRRKLPSKQKAVKADPNQPPEPELSPPPAKRPQQQEKAKGNRLLCGLCKATFTDQNDLKKHTREGCSSVLANKEPKVKTESVPQLPPAAAAATSKFTVSPKRDKSGASEDQTFDCPICDAPFNRRFNRDTHINSHTHDNPCRVCCASYRTAAQLQEHVVATHTQQQIKRFLSITPRTVNCPKCPKLFNSRYLLYYHDQETHQVSFKCSECNTFFPSERHLQRHTLKKHTKKDLNTCEVCEKSFATKQTLNLHIRLHTGDKPVSCPDCKETFRWHSLYRQHRAAHHSHSTIRCAICGQTFSRAFHLNKHLKTHMQIEK